MIKTPPKKRIVGNSSGLPSLDKRNNTFLTSVDGEEPSGAPDKKRIASKSKLIIHGIKHSKTTSIATKSGAKIEGFLYSRIE